MVKEFRPMLAGKADMSLLKFPLIASPKLDGIRTLAMNGVAMSRTLKPIRNRFVQKWFKENAEALEGLDGELIVGEPTATDVYRVTSSGVMGEDGEPNFKFYVFDRWDANTPYIERWIHSDNYIESDEEQRFSMLTYQQLNNLAELEEYEEWALLLGYEGVMLRDPNGPYKQGRSSTKEGILLKLKRYEDAECVITGFEELEHNGNEAKKDALGHTKRSSHQENQVGGDTLGALVVKGLTAFEGIEFKIGTGFDFNTRKDIWNERDLLKGEIVKFKYFAIGVKDAPRHPVFIGFRDASDL